MQEPAAPPGGHCAAATATAPPLPARVSSVTGPRDRKAGRPAPLQAPLPPPGRAADTPRTDGDSDLLTGLKFLLKRSSDHRTSGPVGGGQPRTTPWSGTLDLGLGGLLRRKQAPPQGRLPASSPFRCRQVCKPQGKPLTSPGHLLNQAVSKQTVNRNVLNNFKLDFP